KRRFSDDQVQFVWSVANVLATSIEHARSAAELEEKREQLRALSHKLIEAQDAERGAVARELHDDFGQVLTALRLNLQRRTPDGCGSRSGPSTVTWSSASATTARGSTSPTLASAPPAAAARACSECRSASSLQEAISTSIPHLAAERPSRRGCLWPEVPLDETASRPPGR